ncbi:MULTISPECIES: alkaline shock response membrane anchor protein AmaP [Streptomyces]|uniref:Alkaline shock response membrane anchor protein AmaP n=1 Tax=Streptomyces gilvifuscus TaxID=1550617 RepID=A0ABT5G4V1_9ACTN|nr:MULTISPECIES: alkaline shock response membrane anchor protein AmaP [Streptomyces]MBK3647233.1 alkaline shock response membrane anchor protein AmaP [Streptomyces sp. MBT33]MDC2959865.1 alkaline shock response membrane anchor protein AmaP [Streptomyces gilvifuscus]
MLRTVNRVLLALLGLGLFALGGGVLLGALDLQRHWDFGMPGWWPFRGPDDVVLGAWGRTRWRDEGWWWPTVIAALAVLLALLLWWLLAQRRHRLDNVLVDSEDGVPTRLNGRTLEKVIEEEAEALEGVSRAHVRLTGRRTAPAARVRLLLEPHADPTGTLGRLTGETLAHARDSAGLDRLPAKVRLREARHRAARTA